MQNKELPLNQVTIFADNSIQIEGVSVKLRVDQEQSGTAVYRAVKQLAPGLRYDGNGWARDQVEKEVWERIEMPAKRYVLSTAHPSNGKPGRAQFDLDLLASVSSLQASKEAQEQSRKKGIGR